MYNAYSIGLNFRNGVGSPCPLIFFCSATRANLLACSKPAAQVLQTLASAVQTIQIRCASAPKMPSHRQCAAQRHERSKVRLKLASEPPGLSNKNQSCCSKLLFEDACLCNAYLCSASLCSTLLTGTHYMSVQQTKTIFSVICIYIYISITALIYGSW